MIKFVTLIAVSCSYILTLQAQNNHPLWTEENYRRTTYPEKEFITGYAESGVINSETRDEALQRIKKYAQSDLSEEILVQINSITENSVREISSTGNSAISQSFLSSIKTESNLEINNLKTETFYDSDLKVVYGLAYANRQELIQYNKSSITFIINQIRELQQQSHNFYNLGEKIKARSELEKSIALFAKIDCERGLLISLNSEISAPENENLAILRAQILCELVQLEKALNVCFHDQENMFGSPTEIIANTLKCKLEGCSFTEDCSKADWIVDIKAETRSHNCVNGLCFSYADIIYSLTKVKSNKIVYQEEFSQKGGASDYKKAARKAMEEAGSVLSGKIIKEINK